MTPEFIAILVFAAIVGPMQVVIVTVLWNLSGRLGKVEGLLEGLLVDPSRKTSKSG